MKNKILTREELRNELKAGKISPVYLLFGEETYLRDLAVKTICDKTLASSELREFNEAQFSLAETSLQAIFASADQLPMLSERRVIKLSELNKLKESDEEILNSYLQRPAESSVVIFIGGELDKRKKISKILIENTTCVEFTLLKEFEARAFINSKLKESNTSIDNDALERLFALIGSDLRKLLTEIEKLSAASLPDSIITKKLVEALTPNSKEITNFQLTDQMMAGNRDGALKVLKKILDDGAEPLMLLGLMASNYHKLLLTKELMNEGVARSEVASIMKVPPFKQSEFFASANRADAGKVSGALKRIAEADLAIKTSKATPRLQIELLVAELTQ